MASATAPATATAMERALAAVMNAAAMAAAVEKATETAVAMATATTMAMAVAVVTAAAITTAVAVACPAVAKTNYSRRNKMITESEIYWLTRLDPANRMLYALLFVGIALALVFLVAQLILRDTSPLEKKEDVDRKLKIANWMLFKGFPLTTAIMLMSGTALVFTPTTKEMAAIKIIPAVANSQAVEKLGKSAEMLIDLANSWMQELAPVKNDKGGRDGEEVHCQEGRRGHP